MDLLTRFKDAEKAHRTFLPNARYIGLRLDGKAFHSYTRGLERPADTLLMEAMDKTTAILCKEVAGTVLGYTQSDEMTLVLDVKQNEGSQAWLGAAVQKMVSISAAIATANFNIIRTEQGFGDKIALFDSRVFTFESVEDIADYCSWRRADAIKNSISMAAYAHFPSRILENKNTLERKELLEAAGKPWDVLSEGFKFGRFTYRTRVKEPITFQHGKTGKTETVMATRRNWVQESAADGFDAKYLVNPKPKKKKNKKES